MVDILLYWIFGVGSNYIAAIAPIVVASIIASSAAAAQSAGQAAYGSVQNNRLSRAQRQQNAFNAQQAELDRQWSEHMHDRELEEANTAFQRQTQDMLAAGVNPAILYGSGAGSGAPTASIGSGSAASGSYTPRGLDLNDLGNDLMDIQRKRAEVENIEADTNLKESEATGQTIQNQYAESYWLNQIGIMEESRNKIIQETNLCRQKVVTEAFESAIKANDLDTSWFESQIRMYESFMTKLDYQAKDEIIDLQMRCMRAAAAKDTAQVDVLNEQIGEVVARKVLAMKQAGYFKQLGLKEEAFAQFYGSPEGKQTIKDVAEAEAKQAAIKGKYAGVAFWLDAVGGFVKDVGVGVGAATAVKNFKARMNTGDLNVPPGMADVPVIMN